MKNKQALMAIISFFIAISPAFASDGDLDTAFGTGGVVRTLETGLAGAADVAIQSDDKIVVVAPKNGDFAVLRFNADGMPDTTFGVGGEVTIDFPDGSVFNVRQDVPTAVAIAPDGKIVVGGWTNGGLIIPIFDFALARLNTDGGLDTSFGTGGRVITGFPNAAIDKIFDVAVKANGKIVAAGSTTSGSTVRFAIARYHVDGSLDTSFAVMGKTTVGWGGGFNEARSVAIQADGKIVVAGGEIHNCNGNDVGYFALARFQINGTLDASFGAGGKKKTRFAGCQSSPKGEAFALALQPDGKIVAAGIPFLTGEEWGVARYSGIDGSLDSTFGTGGKTTVLTADNGATIGRPGATAVNNGNIIIGGYGAFFCNDFASANHATLVAWTAAETRMPRLAPITRA